MDRDNITDSYTYLRTFSQELGARIVEMYPPLQGPNDPLPPALKPLLRQPLPAQALTISDVAKHLKRARSAIIVGECGTGKTLMSVAVAHAVAHTHSEGRQYTAIGMCPPHLVFKWAREVLETIPYARTFIIYDLRNGGDPTRPHGVVEMKQCNGQIVHKGLRTTLFELRTNRPGWVEEALPRACILHRKQGDGQAQLSLEACLHGRGIRP
jgi:hypothetical protein